ncbi:MAG: response regulator transcription factor [Lachnospiraceae bacterium]|nr:response regulator transcription factor [Lachnospiraceae bacterium]
MTNNKYKILLIENDHQLSTALTSLLEAEHYQVITADTCCLAKTLFPSHQPDLVILDLDLPSGDGLSFLTNIRESSFIPIAVLSLCTDDSTKVKVLDSGANDYITKPFSFPELLARLRMYLRNYRHNASSLGLPDHIFHVYDLTINYDARQVFIQGEEISFSQTEYNILALLSEHCGKMMSYTSIIKEIWGYSNKGSIKKLQVNMAHIRKKLALKSQENNYITNEPGVGYRMNYEDKIF